MASFEKRAGSNASKQAGSLGHKLPLKRFEPAIYRFTKIAIPMDMDRLDRHKYNLEKYVKWKNWSKLDVERNNAERTIKQLKANIHDMNAIREQVAENELNEFDNKVKSLSDKAQYAIDSLREVIEHSLKSKNEEDDGLSEMLSLSPRSSDTDMLPHSSASNETVFPNSSEMDPKSSVKPTSQPLLRFEVTLRTFTRITIPTAMERLRMHCQNMEKFYDARSWHRLNSEQVNAAITIKHLKKNIQDIEITRCQVPKEELPEFDKRIGPSHERALAAIESFMKFQKKYKDKTRIYSMQDTRTEDDEEDLLDTRLQSPNQQLQAPDETLHSWDELQSSLVELNELIHDFSHLVHDQQSCVDTITSNIENAEINVEDATKELGRATKIQGLLLPTLGAVVGGAVGGPVGMFAGFKAMAVITAVGGGMLGYGATSYIKNQREAAVDLELEKLTDNNSEKER